MKIFPTTLVAAAIFLATGASSAMAENVASPDSYQVSELRLTTVPVPTMRPDATALAGAGDRPAATVGDIRRTAGGIRIVGPTFFPKN